MNAVRVSLSNARHCEERAAELYREFSAVKLEMWERSVRSKIKYDVAVKNT